MSNSTADPALNRQLEKVKNILVVLSGKGGVGKSSVSVQLALSLLNQSEKSQVGLLDIDLTGPSIPRMLGLEGRAVLQSEDGWLPVQTSFGGHSESQEPQDPGGRSRRLKCMSIGFLLKDPKDSVVWRGPKKNAMIRQFLVDVRWGELDWLVIDTPPGTSDEHISLLEQLGALRTHQSQPSSSSPAKHLPTLSSVLVTTPQAVSLLDVSKEYDFTRRTGLKVIGLIENMSGYLCPHCHQIQYVFGSGGGVEFCRRVSSQSSHPPTNQIESNSELVDQSPPSVSQQDSQQLKFLGKIPIDIEFMKLMDQAHHVDSGSDSKSTLTTHSSSPQLNDFDLINQYFKTSTSKIFTKICDQIVQSINGTS